MAVLALIAALALLSVSVPLAYVARAGTAERPVAVVAASRFAVLAERGPSRRALLAGIVVLCVASSAYFTSTSGFYGDDFVNFRQVQLEGLSLRYLLAPTSAHFAPGHRMGDWFLQTVFPMNFAVAQALLLVGFAASLLVFHRLLAELFADARVPLVLTFVYGASMVHVAAHEWWASGLDRVPATFFSFLSILGYLRYDRTRSSRWLSVSVGAFVLAMLFYVKPVFIPLYLLLLRVLLLHPGERLGESVRAAFRQWWVWLLYVVPLAAYSVLYVRAYREGEQIYHPSLGLFGHYLANLWFRVVPPGLIGIYVPKENTSAPAVGLLVAVQVLVVAVIGWSIYRRREAWRAWAFLAAGILANALVVGLTRIGYFGPRYVAYILFYNLEITYLACIAIAAAFFGMSRHPSTAAREPPAAMSGGGRNLLAAALATYLAFSWWGSHRISQADIWPGRRARPYIAHVNAALAGLDRLPANRALVDGTVPDDVLLPVAGPWASQSEVFPVLDAHVSFEATGPDLFQIGNDGRARPVVFAPGGGGDIVTLLRAGAVGFDAARADLRGDALCVVSTKKAALVSIAVPAGSGRDRPAVRLAYSSSDRFVSAFLTEPVGGGKPSQPRYVMLKGPGPHETVFTLPAGPLQRVFFVVSPHGDACVRSVEVGTLQPRA